MNAFGGFVVVVCSTGPALLMVYWIARSWLLLRQPEEVVKRVLDSDLRHGRRIWLFVQMMFAPPQTYSL
ncbi:MAG TPA: hypothetical protein VGP79_02450 [Bryobacteraceae bacterium]|jgi:hypothetical protein|nr:hypothetical protein [Bryobacteraceae bacterium]